MSLHRAAPTEELPSLLDALWRELGRAVHDKHHAWRTPVLATVSSAGDEVAADARTVVLREVKAEARQLLIYTDTRSPKVAQLAANPNSTLLFWSPQKHWQLRVKVRMTLINDPAEVAARWQRVKDSPSAGDYLSAQPPGAALNIVAPRAALNAVAPGRPLPDNSAASTGECQTPHFGVLVATATHFDWLELARSGHRRAGFDLRSGEARWLVP